MIEQRVVWVLLLGVKRMKKTLFIIVVVGFAVDFIVVTLLVAVKAWGHFLIAKRVSITLCKLKLKFIYKFVCMNAV